MTTPTTVNVRLQLRADTAANWTAANPTLLANEVGLETDTKKLKVGNGSSAWNSLAYFPSIVSGGTVLGNLEIGSTGTLTFEGSTADGFETTLAVTNPTADRTITLPNQSGTVVVSGNASIVDADIAANAEIAVSKLADGAARQLLQTDAAGTGVEWTSNVDIPGTLDVTGAATFDGAVTVAGDLTVNGTTTNINTQNLVVEDKNIILGDVATPSDTTADGGGITLKGATDKTINWIDATDAWTSSERFSVPLGSAASPSLTFTGDENSGVYSPGSDQVAIATGGTGRLFVDASGNVGAGTSTPATLLHVDGGTITCQRYANSGAIILRRAEGTQSSPTAISASVALSNLVSRGYDGSAYREAAGIQVFSDGAISSTSSPGFIAFGTTPSGAVNTQERLRITSAGLVGVGTSAPQTQLQVGNGGGTGAQATHKGTVQISSAPVSLANEGGLEFKTSEFGSGYGWKIAGCVDGSANPLIIGNRDNSATWSPRLTLTAGGNVGIGTTSPNVALDVYRASGATTVRVQSGAGIGDLAHDGTNLYLANAANGPLQFWANNSERVRIDSSGRLLVGTSSARTQFFNGVNIPQAQFEGVGLGGALSVINNFTTATNETAGLMVLARNGASTVGNNTLVANGNYLGWLSFQGNDGTDFVEAASIRGEVDGTPGANDMPGRLVFSTTADGASSPTERMRISQAGDLMVGRTSSQNANTAISFENNDASRNVQWNHANNASFGNTVAVLSATRAANSGYKFLEAVSSWTGTFDIEFNLRGDGNAFADGTWSGGGADYAEYFEWSDSNPDSEDRRGISVVLDGDKIREAQPGEDPIGVISGNPSVVGDAAWNKWSGKYLRDEFGTYIQEDYEVTDDDGNTVIQQRRKLNPAYDPDVEYVSREQRPEWDCVGLMGKLRIRKGQVTGSRWIKMRDINDSVEEWLVR